MPRLALLIVTLVALNGCNEPNSAFCENPANAGRGPCPDAGNGGPCRDNADCTTNTPVCDTTVSPATCVQCTASDHALCTGITPICESNTCVACVTDDNCGTGGLCLPSGACATADNIIHAVASGGETMTPCGTTSTPCTLTVALTAVDATRNVIKLDDAGPYAVNGGFIVAANVTIDARGATLGQANDSPIVTVASGKTVTIFGGTIQGATGGGSGDAGDGIQCNSSATLAVHGTTIQMNEASAIDATDCTLTVTAAEIRGNGTNSSNFFPGIETSGGSLTISQTSIASNRGGGIVINSNAKFEIVGNVFFDNGDIGATVGGVSVDTTVSGTRLEFNTITQNKSQTTLAAGVQCKAAGGFTAQNNIIWNNNSAQGTLGIQVSGCSYAYSDIGPAVIPAVNDGGNNLNADPTFVNAASDLHLLPSTPIRGKANPGAELTGLASKDIDGNVRVVPATPGAYVAPPQ